jgi:hypothetical protein
MLDVRTAGRIDEDLRRASAIRNALGYLRFYAPLSTEAMVGAQAEKALDELLAELTVFNTSGGARDSSRPEAR